ncbi:DUF2089 domain-containing protein [Oscillospiraceae bacterium PP1C4]
MNRNLPKKCPACAQDMHVRVLRCSDCQTEVQGDFELDRFSQLTAEHRLFLETFIRFRGNLKDAGTSLGISYPTARNRLDALIEALGFENASSAAVNRLEVLEQLKNGIITTEQALILLQGGEKDE